ncbi:hypothetical protein [Micromonospora coxensis]|uniref:hypothetical protein n=1 Tax=Micromonospora coxensis TaxID=356852 RepID=UPI0012FD7C7B|nr:hypothetical protein [Micromonospora coxensis]
MDDVRARVADHDEPVTFFCGGSRTFHAFIDLFDGVFVLDLMPSSGKEAHRRYARGSGVRQVWRGGCATAVAAVRGR